jgi:phosphoglycolate phosphatase-like HAD superfamily hydrolase
MIGRLVLWDVDGTLVRAGELGAAVFDQAIADVLGELPPIRVRMSGKTDPEIVREYLEAMGVDDDQLTVRSVLRALESRMSDVAAELAAAGRACPGAAEALRELDADRTVLSSVLTGNIAANAVVKLAAFGLDRWLDLEVGAYGSDDDDRTMLVPIAMARAAEHRGVRLEPGDVWVVGDTPRDLLCAQAAGARCLLVATGRYPVDELARLGPDAVLEDLADTAAVVKLLVG